VDITSHIGIIWPHDPRAGERSEMRPLGKDPVTPQGREWVHQSTCWLPEEGKELSVQMGSS
jgi:hypothetical protein